MGTTAITCRSLANATKETTGVTLQRKEALFDTASQLVEDAATTGEVSYDLTDSSFGEFLTEQEWDSLYLSFYEAGFDVVGTTGILTVSW